MRGCGLCANGSEPATRLLAGAELGLGLLPIAAHSTPACLPRCMLMCMVHGLPVCLPACLTVFRVVLAEGPAIIYNVPGRTGGLADWLPACLLQPAHGSAALPPAHRRPALPCPGCGFVSIDAFPSH